MPALKVFVSSTCYDLTNLRDGLRNFIGNLGYEAVMSDYADILYDPRIHTHPSCIEEVKNCDILVLIIGGRFGGKAIKEAEMSIDFERLKNDFKIETLSENEIYSITQLEVLKAVELGIPVYTFIKADVWGEHKLYEQNKNSSVIEGIVFPSIEKPDTAKYIFEFINFIRLREKNNNIFPFEKESDIEDILKKQWSSYFQKLLKEQLHGCEKIDKNKLEKKIDGLQDLVFKFIQETPHETTSQVGGNKKHRRILWVDDYPSNNEAVMTFFEEQNIHFDIAISTEQGLKLYKKELYDIVITDMGRGYESDAGLKLIKELKRLQCKIPIIVYCSRKAIFTYGQKARELGAYSVENGIANITSLISGIYGLTS